MIIAFHNVDSIFKLTLLLILRRLGEESDGELYMDTSSESSSECEADRLRERGATMGTTIGQGGFLSDDGEACTAPLLPIFEYLERDPPYGREPLADKASYLCLDFLGDQMSGWCSFWNNFPITGSWTQAFDKQNI